MKLQRKIGVMFILICLAMGCFGVGSAWSELVGNWTFDSCDGDDETTNNHDGVLVGDPLCVSGKVGSALELDGEDDDGDYVSIPDSSDFDFESFSVCAWIYLFTDGKGMIISHNKSFDLSVDAYQKLNFGVWIGGHLVKSSPADIPFNEWTCVCVTYGPLEGGNGMVLYVNGQEVESHPSASTVITQSDDPLTIGFIYGGGSFNYWEGRIDEVRLYNHELTPSEVVAYCSAGPSPCTCSDSDSDGVPDAWDQCPNTSAGKATDSVGCAAKSGVVVIPF